MRQNEILHDILWCCSLRARYICIVAVQHCHSGKIDLLILSKLVGVEKSVFTSSHVLLQIQFINLLGSNEEVPQRASRKTFQIQMPWILLMCFPVGNWSTR